VTEPDPGLNGRTLRYPRGRVLGGCSSINGMIYMRGQARDYDLWADLTGEPDWSWQNVLPDFRAHEDHYRMDGTPDPAFAALHGRGGEWRVEKQRLKWDILEAFIEACVAAGIARTDDFNAGTNEGVGYFEVNQRGGLRWNTARAFLRPVRGRPNLAVWTEAEVEAVAIAEGHNGLAATGVRLRRAGGTPVEVEARREVILAAGAINSPKLLMLSGIGPGARLAALGLPVRADLPGVGENLQDHLQIRAVYRVDGAKTLNTLAAGPVGKARIALEYALRRTGPMSMAPSQLGAFTRSSPERAHPNIEFHVQPLSLEAFGEPLHPYPAFTASVCNLNPTSRGRVELRGSDPAAPPAIRPNYLATEEDRTVAAESLRVVRGVVAQPALARFRPEELKPGPSVQSDEALAREAGNIATTIFHPVGTTAMGRDGDPAAVLDPHLRVRDGRGGRIAGLRVVDAGAMPVIPSGNTNAPVLMMAEKAARWIRAGV
jgi:choline dehydrogenase